jgi:hypothetical protein
MSWKTFAALVVLAAGFGAFYAYDTYWLSPARDKAESVKGRLWQVEAKDVETVTIKRKSETVKLARAGEGWEMLEPVKARADRGAVEGLVTSLTTVRVDREIDPSPAKLTDFGLDTPDAEVTMQVKGQKEPLALLLGGKSPTGAWVYGKEAAKPAVLALSDSVSREAARPVQELRDKTVLAFDRKSVTGIDLDVGGDQMSVEAQDGGKWRIVKPRDLGGDPDIVAEFLDKLGAAKIVEFVPGVDKPAQYGLDKPAKLTLWTGKDKDRASKSLLFGRPVPDKKGVYVMRPGETEAMLTGEELWTAFPKTVGALRNKVVVTYAYDKVKRLDLESPKGPVSIEKEASGWKLTGPETLKADTGAVTSLLWRLRDLRASGFLGDEAADIPRYLARPEVTVRIWEEGAKEPRTLLLGASKETRGGMPAAVAAVAGQGPVMLVDGKALQDLAKATDDLRDKSLVPAFDLGDLKGARLSAGGKRIVVERVGDLDWKLVEPRGSLKAGKVTDVLLALKGLTWKAIVSPKGDDAARYGLDAPQAEVTLIKRDGTELATLLVGRDEGDVSYVRLKSGPAIYSVDGKAVGDIRKAPTEIPG